MDSKHHCDDCPYWYVTKKKYPSGFYDITICRKYGKQIYYLAGDKNRTPYPCSICEKEFSYVPYMEQELLQEVEKMTERLSDKNPCTNCKADRQIGNPNRWECECSRCDKPNDWKNDCVKKLAEYETAEEEGRLLVLPCKVGDKVYIIDDIDYSYERDSVVTGIDIDKDGVSIMIQDETSVSSSGYEISDFGETIFLSKENALKKLKELMQDE